jgi:hypothetical protein
MHSSIYSYERFLLNDPRREVIRVFWRWRSKRPYDTRARSLRIRDLNVTFWRPTPTFLEIVLACTNFIHSSYGLVNELVVRMNMEYMYDNFI